MKAFSPAGMAVKALFGYTARTFGNPDGALTGGGAYVSGGANANGPNQGGGAGGGGGTALSGLTTIVSVAGNNAPFHHAGDGFWSPGFLAAAGGSISGGSPQPAGATLGGSHFDGIWWSDRDKNGTNGSFLFLAVHAVVPVTGVFNSIAFTDRLGVLQSYLESDGSGWTQNGTAGYSWWIVNAAATTFPFDGLALPIALTVS
jgi:hypothetical protein